MDVKCLNISVLLGNANYTVSHLHEANGDQRFHLCVFFFLVVLLRDVVRRNHRELSLALARVEMRRDGRVRLEDLQSVLAQHGCHMAREQLTQHLHRYMSDD